MTDDRPHQVTELLDRIAGGSRSAADELLPLLYSELRRLAHARMGRERPGQTLQATELVHEAYLRLVGQRPVKWDNRGHFFAAAAEAMRRILIERARHRQRLRHGGGQVRVDIEAAERIGSEPPSVEILAIDEALTRLEAQDARMAQVVKLRYFAGLSVEETAKVTGSAPRTVNRQWTAARSWLRREMGRQAP